MPASEIPLFDDSSDEYIEEEVVPLVIVTIAQASRNTEHIRLISSTYVRELLTTAHPQRI